MDEGQRKLYLRLRPARVWIWYYSEAAEPLWRVRFFDFVEASFGYYLEVLLQTVK